MKAKVSFVRPEVLKKLPGWALMRAVLGGEEAMREAGDLYLPRPNASDKSEENKARYTAYLQRAVFFAATSRTQKGLVGYVFSKPPTLKLPATLKVLEENADGAGVGLTQQAKKALGLSLAFGRCGLFVDYPKSEATADTTRRDQMEGAVQPTITLYPPEAVINWRVIKVGSKLKLSLVVIEESFSDPTDEYGFEEKKQWRVLKLVNGVYTSKIVRIGSNGEEVESDVVTPTKSDETNFDYIPFTFVGPENNDADIDDAPLADLATLNVGHWHNSADYEETVYRTGQPTYWVSGLPEDWLKRILGGVIQLGACGGIPLPQGASAGILQAAPNILPGEAMKHKEALMVALGAKLINPGGEGETVTATEASMDNASEVSVLINATNNLFAAYKFALTACGEFAGDAATIEYDLAEPLVKDAFTAETASALIALIQGQLIAYPEARKFLRRSGIAYMDDDEARDVIDSDLELSRPDLAFEKEQAAKDAADPNKDKKATDADA